MTEKNDQSNSDQEMSERTYYRGPVIMRGPMIPTDTTTGNLLASESSNDWLHMDPWRVLRIQAEFVDGFGALAEVGPAVVVFGSARTDRSDPVSSSSQGGKSSCATWNCNDHGWRTRHYGGSKSWCI